jgi:hypothetical protein
MARTDLGAVAYWHFATDAIGGTPDAEGRAAMAPPDAIGTHLGHWPTVPATIRCGSVFVMAFGGGDEPQPRLTGTGWHTGNAP